jgi:hypothetical protein
MVGSYKIRSDPISDWWTWVEGKISHSNQASTPTCDNNNITCSNGDALLTIDMDELLYSSTSATTPPAQLNTPVVK